MTSHPAGPSDAGAVVLDIGEHHGALVVTTPAHLCGSEIEIRRVGTPWTGTHTAVRERRQPGRVLFAGVSPALEAGAYELRLRGHAVETGMAVGVEPGMANQVALVDTPR